MFKHETVLYKFESKVSTSDETDISQGKLTHVLRGWGDSIQDAPWVGLRIGSKTPNSL